MSFYLRNMTLNQYLDVTVSILTRILITAMTRSAMCLATVFYSKTLVYDSW